MSQTNWIYPVHLHLAQTIKILDLTSAGTALFLVLILGKLRLFHHFHLFGYLNDYHEHERIYIYLKEHLEGVNHNREGWSTSASKIIQRKTTIVKIVIKVASLNE